ncbi:MAG: ROK family protein [Chloroflexi bacterium]|nr:ROK family protein [Chloroflexota bacterium]
MLTRRSLTGSSSSAIKSHNLRAILLTLLRHGQASRVRIAQLTGLSTTTITNLITELLLEGVVEENGTEVLNQQRGVGRPRTALRLVPGSRYAVGIHVDVGRIRVAMVDLYASPLQTFEFTHPMDQPAEEVLAKTRQLVHQAIDQSQVPDENIVGIGIGASGLVDTQEGINVLAPSMGWHDVPLRDWFAEQFELPVFVDNNVRAMALAESLFGAGKDVYVLAYVYSRVGVGAGFVVGGQLYRGGAGAGEIGHVTILADHGAPCRCGSTGCLETLVSEGAIVARARDVAADHPHSLLAQYLQEGDSQRGHATVHTVFDAAREGDLPACELLNERARYMGIGLANLVNTLSPQMIILGGIFAQGRDLLFPVVQQTMRDRAFANLGEHVVVQTPTFGFEEGVIGAASLALDAFFFKQSEVSF